MPAKVKNARGTKAKAAKADPDPPHEAGRAAQRNRTRKAIVDTAMELLATGKTPSITDIALAAEISRRTIYMYFPTLEQLLLDATVGALSKEAVDPVIAPGTGNAVSRIEELTRALNGLSERTLHLGRSLIRLTIEGNAPQKDTPRRGYRRIEWIERALEPARRDLSRREFDRLVSALSLVIGWEALIVLKDVRGLGQKEAEEVLVFAARAITEAALRPPLTTTSRASRR